MVSFSTRFVWRDLLASIVVFSIAVKLLGVADHIFTALFTRNSCCNRESVNPYAMFCSKVGRAKALLDVPSQHGWVVSWVDVCLH